MSHGIISGERVVCKMIFMTLFADPANFSLFVLFISTIVTDQGKNNNSNIRKINRNTYIEFQTKQTILHKLHILLRLLLQLGAAVVFAALFGFDVVSAFQLYSFSFQLFIVIFSSGFFLIHRGLFSANSLFFSV